MDTRHLGSNVGQWFAMGQAGGGRLSGTGQALKVLVDTLKEDRTLKQEKALDEEKFNREQAGKKELLEVEYGLKDKYRDPLDTYKTNLDILGKEQDIAAKGEEAERKRVEDWSYDLTQKPPASLLGSLQNIRSNAVASSPVSVGKTTEGGGGSVIGSLGSYAKNGVIYDISGNEVGSYLDEAEPQKLEEITSALETEGVGNLKKSLKAGFKSKKFGGDQDYKDSLRDWASGVVDDDEAFVQMLASFPEKAKEIGEFYFQRTGRLRPTGE